MRIQTLGLFNKNQKIQQFLPPLDSPDVPWIPGTYSMTPPPNEVIPLFFLFFKKSTGLLHFEVGQTCCNLLLGLLSVVTLLRDGLRLSKLFQSHQAVMGFWGWKKVLICF